VTVEKRQDGTRQIRFKSRYLKYVLCGKATTWGALPPNARSLSRSRAPAEDAQSEGWATTTQPSAVCSADGRAGRSPAEPYPSDGDQQDTPKPPWRPPPEHRWRKFRIKRQAKQEDTSILAR